MADQCDDKAEKQKRRDEARKVHETVSLIGLRAQATSVGLVQLVAELVRADVIDDEAVGRIREAIMRDILVTNVAMRGKTDFEESLRKRLESLFPNKSNIDSGERKVGSSEDFGHAIGVGGGEAERDEHDGL